MIYFAKKLLNDMLIDHATGRIGRPTFYTNVRSVYYEVIMKAYRVLESP